MLAEIVTIGTELLLGQVVNTNATWIALELARLGIDLHRVDTVGDNMGRLVETLETAWGRADLVICTGGLGPTADDITIAAIAHVLGEPLEERPAALAHVEGLFARRGRSMTDLDRKQARFPPSAELIPNQSGTAFGACATRAGRRLMAFPGVPAELEAMWLAWAAPRLEADSGATIHSTLLKFCGCSESELGGLLGDVFDGTNPTVAPYTATGEVQLRLTAKAATSDAAVALLAPLEAEILSRAQKFYFGRDGDTLPGTVGARLRTAGQTVAVAESATGGLLASRLTDIPGSSDWFRGGAVVYSRDAKIRLAGVPPGTIADHGAVSRQTTEALASGIRTALGAAWGVGTTGYAGPGPGVPDADAGLMHVAICGPDGRISSREYRWGHHGRNLIKYFATQRALHGLLRRLKAHDQAAGGCARALPEDAVAQE